MEEQFKYLKCIKFVCEQTERQARETDEQTSLSFVKFISLPAPLLPLPITILDRKMHTHTHIHTCHMSKIKIILKFRKHKIEHKN